MQTFLNRIGAVALVLLVLAGAGVWWWQRPDGADHATAAAGLLETDPATRALQPQSSDTATATKISSPIDACGHAMRAVFNARAGELRERQDAASQLAYGLAVPINPSGRKATPKELEAMLLERHAEARRAFLRAAELAPRDPEVLWLAASHCGNEPECRGVQAALLAAEPDNMAVWQWEMTWARMRKDPEAAARAFDAMASASRLDRHVGAIQEAMLDAYGDLTLPDACKTASARAAMRTATGSDRDFDMMDMALMLASVQQAIPPFSDLSENCAPAKVNASGKKLRADCVSVFDRLANGETLIERWVALPMLIQLTADAADATRWRERYRELRWMAAQMSDPEITALMQVEDYSLEEVDSLRAVLEASNHWPPPTDWLPDDEHARSLILTGRPPPESRR